MTVASDGLPDYVELLARTDGPSGSVWGLWGDDDEVGALNLLSAADAIVGAACVRSGEVFSLNYPLNAFPPSAHRPRAAHTIISMSEVVLDDRLDSFYLQQTTQIDGLRHVRHGVHGHYAGVSADALVVGSPTLGVQRWADGGIAGRGVLIDVARYCEQVRGRPLEHAGGEPIPASLLDDVLAWEGVELQRHDLVVIRTDHPRHWLAHPDEPLSSAGLEQSHETLAWIWDHRIPLVASDNAALECVPVIENSPFAAGHPEGAGMMHTHLIPLLGVVIGERWRLDDLARACADDRRYQFQLVAQPLALIGGVGSPANATAIR